MFFLIFLLIIHSFIISFKLFILNITNHYFIILIPSLYYQLHLTSIIDFNFFLLNLLLNSYCLSNFITLLFKFLNLTFPFTNFQFLYLYFYIHFFPLKVFFLFFIIYFLVNLSLLQTVFCYHHQ